MPVAAQESPAPVGSPAPAPATTPAPSAADPSAAPRPDILVIMLDDHPEIGTAVLERLPNIRRLFLRHGVRFTDYQGNDPLCCPGRAAFLTGLTTDHHGVDRNDIRLLDASVTLATELQDAGYFTFMAGKYLNGGLGPKEPGIGPLPGWDRHAYTTNGFYGYTETRADGRVVRHGRRPQDYQPDVAFARARSFLRAAPADRPVFGWITPFATHSGFDPFDDAALRWHYPAVAPRHRDDPRCADLAPWRTPAHTEPATGEPAYLTEGPEDFRDGYDLVRICESLLSVDEGIGRLVRELDARGRRDDALLVLTADNGMGWGAFGWYAKTVPFSTGMPLLVHWPAGRGRAAATDPAPVTNLDLAPTLCAAAGCAMGPYADGRADPDGISVLPVLTGTGRLVRDAVYLTDRDPEGRAPDWWAVRSTDAYPGGRWQYAELGTGETTLHDVSGGPCSAWAPGDPGDPCMLANRAGDPALAALQADLAALLARARASGGADPAIRGRIEPPVAPASPRPSADPAPAP